MKITPSYPRSCVGTKGRRSYVKQMKEIFPRRSVGTRASYGNMETRGIINGENSVQNF